MPPKLDLSKLPWQKVMTSEPIEQLLRAQPVTPGQRNQEERTNAWKDAKIAELSFLGLTVGLQILSVVKADTEMFDRVPFSPAPYQAP